MLLHKQIRKYFQVEEAQKTCPMIFLLINWLYYVDPIDKTFLLFSYLFRLFCSIRSCYTSTDSVLTTHLLKLKYRKLVGSKEYH